MSAQADGQALERARARLRRATYRLRWTRIYAPAQLQLLRYVAALSYRDLRDGGMARAADLIVRAGRRS